MYSLSYLPCGIPGYIPSHQDLLIINCEQTTYQDNDNFEKLEIVFYQSPGAESWSVRCGKFGRSIFHHSDRSLMEEVGLEALVPQSYFPLWISMCG